MQHLQYMLGAMGSWVAESVAPRKPRDNSARFCPVTCLLFYLSVATESVVRRSEVV